MKFIKIDSIWIRPSKIEFIEQISVRNSIDKTVIHLDSGKKVPSYKLSAIELIKLIEDFAEKSEE